MNSLDLVPLASRDLTFISGGFGGEDVRQSQARSMITSQLEHKSTRQVAISARNPPDTKSWLRMEHLLSLKEAGPNLLKISESAAC